MGALTQEHALVLDEGCVIWVTHPNYKPAWFVLDPGAALPERIELEPASPVRVKVVDGDERPMANVEVLTFLTDQPTASEAIGLPETAHGAFVRSAVTDEDGLALLPPGVGEQHAMARVGQSITAPWYGRAPAEVRLVLVAGFRVSGRVNLRDSEADPEQLFVTAYSATGTMWRTLGRASVSRDGTYGPIETARDEEGKLLMRLEGPGVQPQEKRMAFPLPGGSVSVDFEPIPGVAVPVLVTDDLGEPVPIADVRAWWQSEGEWFHAHARTDAEGLATPYARPGELLLVCDRTGFVNADLPSQTILETPPEPFSLRMSRAGQIRGRVLRGDTPVATFRVRYWGEGRVGSNEHFELDTSDGAFLIASAPLGEVTLYAIEEGSSPSELQRVTVVPGVTSEVNFQLPAAVRGHGSVVDAFSGLGISKAWVQAWVVEGSRWVDATGAHTWTDAQGNFDLAGLATGMNHLRIGADGYAQTQRVVQVAPGEEADIGRVALVPVHELTIRLIAPPDVDPTLCEVYLNQAISDTKRHFSPEGTVVYLAQQAGSLAVIVTLPSGVEIRQHHFLPAGRPWELRVPVDETRQAGLDVLVRNYERFEGELSIFTNGVLPGGADQQRTVPVHEGRAFVPGPLGEVLWLDLRLNRSSILLSRQLGADELGVGRIEIDAANESRTFLVLDRQRQPLRDVTLTLVTQPYSGWAPYGQTDSSGRVLLAFPSDRELRANMRHPEKGGLLDRPVEVPSDAAREIEILFDPDARLDLIFEDRGVRLPGVRSHLTDVDRYALAMGWSDAEGRADSGPIGSGSFYFEILEHHLWPLRMPVEVRPGANALTVELRRIGGLRLSVQRPGGQKETGAAISVRSLEFDKEMTEWAAQGRIQLPPGGMVSDAQGELRLGGLPNGPYRYSIRTQDGRSATGELTVPPHGEGRAVVTLAPD